MEHGSQKASWHVSANRFTPPHPLFGILNVHSTESLRIGTGKTWTKYLNPTEVTSPWWWKLIFTFAFACQKKNKAKFFQICTPMLQSLRSSSFLSKSFITRFKQHTHTHTHTLFLSEKKVCLLFFD